VEALEELSEQAAKLGGWQLTLDLAPIDEMAECPDKSTCVTIYRIAQEALNNICKHANAQQVRMALWQDEGIHLYITDDGVGFEQPPRENGSGWGLRTMRERVHLLGGHIKIASQPDEGTTLTIWIPNDPLRTRWDEPETDASKRKNT
jgi:signal transduction histidine kinase